MTGTETDARSREIGVPTTREGVIRSLASACPVSPSASGDLERSVAFLDWSVDPEDVVAAGYVLGVVVAVAVAPTLVVVPPTYRFAAVPTVLALGLGTTHAVHRAPVALATLRRTTALGEAPGVIARAVLRMRVAPTAESAAAFAAESGRGPLAASLGRHVRQATGAPRSGFAKFADEWREWFPALQRSTDLVIAAADAPPARRDRTLDRAVSAVLEGARDQMAEFSESVRGPATALYAFGVLLPLALVAVLPAARVAGLPVSVGLVAVIYDVVLPMVVLGVGAHLLARRPVAFPPPDVSREHPDVPDARWPPLVGGATAGGVAFLVTPLAMSAWTAPLAAVGTGVGVALVGLYRPIATVRRRVRAVETGLPDALYLVGRRIAEGEAVETAVERAADEVTGATGAVLSEAVAVGARLRVDVRDSLIGEHGALADVPSPRTRSAAALLGAATREGRPAGEAVVAMAEHLKELDTLEREARRELARVTGTLAQTGAVFAPLVAGATVALSEGMSVGVGGPGPTPFGAGGTATGIETAALGTTIGVYVLFLAVALTVLSTGLDRGLDRALVGHRVGRALLSAVGIYLGTVKVVGMAV